MLCTYTNRTDEGRRNSRAHAEVSSSTAQQRPFSCVRTTEPFSTLRPTWLASETAKRHSADPTHIKHSHSDFNHIVPCVPVR